MATHSIVLAWRIPWTESLAGYSPEGHKESDMTERLNNNKGNWQTVKLFQRPFEE